jgi:AcrR family transcriptional regulator
MPRPSLADVRTEELLDAFARCVARFGLDGSTLERISEEAGVGRPLLRHYLGNRDQMVRLLFDHVMMKFSIETDQFFDTLPQRNRLRTLIDALFDGGGHDSDNAPVYQALVVASGQYAGMAEKLLGFVTRFEQALVKELVAEFPMASLSECEVVASGVTAIYFNHDTALPLAPPSAWRARQKSSAEVLINSLRR